MFAALGRQFHQPSGLLGWVVGWFMASAHRQRNQWTIELLDLTPTDSVLEIGFGPGMAIQEAAKIARFVAGVDPSSVMLAQASRRNAPAIARKKVELHLAGVENLPFAASSFDKAFAINTLHHWEDRQRGMAEIQRVLKSEGMLLIYEQPVPGAKPMSAEAMAARNAEQLQKFGFQAIQHHVQQTKKSYRTAVIGRTP